MRRTHIFADACLRYRTADLKAALAAVLPEVGYNGDVDDFVRYWFEKDSNLDAEVFEFVRKVHAISGAEMFLATGQEHHRAGYLWNELGFSKYFDAIFYSAKIGLPKTDLRFFDTINHALLISPEERPLFFDDTPAIVALARQAGWDATLFRSASDIRDHPRLEHLWG